MQVTKNPTLNKICAIEVVVKMDIHVGDNDVGVEKSLKKDEKSKATKRRERSHGEVSGRELGLSLQFHSF